MKWQHIVIYTQNLHITFYSRFNICQYYHIMADQWHDNSTLNPQVRDDDDIPDEWDQEPEEKVCLFST
jgi:hypothetical protein